ncbi:hypothetical protein HMPREF2626_01595 [Aerococcus sp. HMSC062A02]|uniref:hypothetical protein n=1 Tax=Aerococcus sp. HMSC062A02 TaxID=1715105 RepID=UPI0008A4688A|nr:hypothetical protein [Aerococcus sp. HMSC062A02]OFN02631.1 hypothetical protein HMPREF2626_01595 [Aerococcus sp. HMSC062A02]
MRLYPSTLYLNVDSGEKDRMGNTIYTPVKLVEGKARLANWTVQEMNLLDRKLTESTQKVLTDFRFDLANQADYIAIDSKTDKLKIKNVTQVGRWVVLYVERWRT